MPGWVPASAPLASNTYDGMPPNSTNLPSGNTSRARPAPGTSLVTSSHVAPPSRERWTPHADTVITVCPLLSRSWMYGEYSVGVSCGSAASLQPSRAMWLPTGSHTNSWPDGSPRHVRSDVYVGAPVTAAGAAPTY